MTKYLAIRYTACVEDTILICARVTSLVYLAIPGHSTDQRCKDCGEAVIIAPKGQRLLKENKEVKIMCYECFSKNYQGQGEVGLAA